MPAPEHDTAGVFTRSERLLLDFQKVKAMSAADIRDLFHDVLSQPDFDSEDVDADMHNRLMRAVDTGETEVHDMWAQGDGEQDVRFYMRNVESVVRELLADERLAHHQHFAFKEYKNARGDRILGGHANGSITFQMAQMEVGPGKVPISIVL